MLDINYCDKKRQKVDNQKSPFQRKTRVIDRIEGGGGGVALRASNGAARNTARSH